MAIVQNFVIDQGSTFVARVNVYTSEKTNFNLTDYTAQSQMRKMPASTVIAEFACTIPSPKTNGQIILTLTDEQTLVISPGRYMYDVVISSVAGEKYRAVEGIITVKPLITR
jgi:hypothetical protein